MESIRFRCSSCKRALEVPADTIGQMVACPLCGAEQTVTTPPTTAGGPQETRKQGGAKSRTRPPDETQPVVHKTEGRAEGDETAEHRPARKRDGRRTKRATEDDGTEERGRGRSLSRVTRWRRVRLGLLFMIGAQGIALGASVLTTLGMWFIPVTSLRTLIGLLMVAVIVTFCTQ